MGLRCRYARRAVVAVAGVILVSACAGRGPAPAGSSSPAGPAYSTVALGDSVPAGTACECVPYPELAASSLTVAGSREVTAANDAIGGSTTEDVLAQLSSRPEVSSRVAQADVVEIEIGANDVAHSRSCGTAAACYGPGVSMVEHNLGGIVARVRELTQRHRTLVVLLDYWSVWLGGQYAHDQGAAYVDAAATVTDEVNSVIKQTAAQTGAAYVDLRAAFKGPDYAYDETHYLASDGDHPNEAGHRQIAAALVDVITKTLHAR